MPTTIDERVVSMQFDNGHFEKNASTTMRTLEKLRQSLRFDGATNGLESVAEASKKLDFSELEATSTRAGFHFRDVWLKVSEVFEYQIARKIIDSSKRMIKSLTIDPVKTGLTEYETQLNAIQTILANTESKGSTLEDVNGALDELNRYADKTIYNFTEMTKNIGTFTAAGVDLDTSVSAIKGIANLAAVSGSTSQQASTAMYQLSQALSSGTVRLMDWNSVVNAGMGGEVFQNALKDTARVHGIAIDDMIKQNGSFRESLKEEWLTAEILTETLSKFTGDLNAEQLKSMGYTEKQIEEIIKLGQTANDAATKVKTFSQLLDTSKEAAQSGWAQTWEIIIGDFEEAKSLWTGASKVFGDIINKSAEARNNLLSGTFNSGWKQLMGAGIMDEAMYSDTVKQVARDHGIAIDQMIKEEGSLEKALRKGFESGTISSNVLSESLISMADSYQHCSDAQLKEMGYTREQVDQLRLLAYEVQNGKVSMDKFADSIKRLSGRELLFNMEFDSEGVLILNEKTGALVNIFAALGKMFKVVKDAWRDVFPATTSEQLYNLLENFRKFTASLILGDKAADGLKRTFRGLFSVVDILWTVFKSLFSIFVSLVKAILPVGTGIANISGNLGDLLFSLRNIIKASNAVTDSTKSITNGIEKAGNALQNFIRSCRERIDTSGLSGLLNVLKKVWNILKTIGGKIISVFKAIGKAIGSAFSGITTGDGINAILSAFNIALLYKIYNVIKGFFSDVGDYLDVFKEVIDSVTGTLQSFQQKLKAEAIKQIAIAIGILVASLIVLTLIDRNKLEEALAALTLVFAELIIAMYMLGDIKSTNIAKTAFLAVGAALLLIAMALKKVSTLEWEQIGSGLTALGGCLVILLATLYSLSLIEKKLQKDGTAIDTAIKQLRKLAFSLIIIASAFRLLAKNTKTEIQNGLLTMAGALGILVGVIFALSYANKVDGATGASSGAKNIQKLAWSLIPMAVALKMLGRLNEGEIKRSLILLASVLGMMTIVSIITSKFTKSSAGAPKDFKSALVKIAQIVAISHAVLVAVLAVAALAFIPRKKLMQGMLAMTAILGLLTITVAALSRFTSDGKGCLKSIAVLIVIVAAINALTAPLIALSMISWNRLRNALLAMGGVIGVLVTTLTALFMISNKNINIKNLLSVMGSLVLIALTMNVLAGALVILAALSPLGIVKGILAVAAAMALFAVACVALAPLAPMLTLLSSAILKFGVACVAIGAGLALIAWGMSILSTTVGPAINAICTAIVDNADMIGKAAEKLIVSLLRALVNIADQLVKSLFDLILNALKSLVEYVPPMVAALMDLIVAVVEELINYIPAIVKLVIKVLKALVDAVFDELGGIDIKFLTKALIGVGAIAAVMYALSAVAGLIPGAMLGVLGVGAVMIELSLVLALVGWLFSGNKIDKHIDRAGEILSKLTRVIGKAIGAFIDGIASEIHVLSYIGTELSNFMTNVQPFIEGAKNINSKVLSGVASLAGAILLITGTSVLYAIGRFLGMSDPMTTFGINLSLLGKGVQKFYEQTKGINSDILSKSADACLTLATMASKIPASGGIWQMISGKKSLPKFAAQLPILGLGVKLFTKSISGVNYNGADDAAKVGERIATMASKIPTSGGLWQKIAGGKNMAKFAAEMALFGLGVKNFAKSVSNGISYNNADVAAKVGERIATMASKIPTSGGLWQMIAGGKNLTKFAAEMALFGLGVKNFTSKLATGVSYDNADVAAKVGERIATMAAKIPTTGGLWQMIAGGKNLSRFAVDVALFGTGVKNFANKVKGLNYNGADEAAKVGERIATMASKIPTSGGLWQIIAGGQDLGSFATQIALYGLGIKNFAKNVKGIEGINMDVAVEAGIGLAKVAKSIPDSSIFNPKSYDMASFKEQMGSFGKGVANFASHISKATFDAAKTKAAVDAGMGLAVISNKIPKKVNDASSFATQIATFGKGVAGFAKNVTPIENIENAVNIMSAAVRLTNAMTLISLVPSYDGITAFTNSLPTLGSNLATFYGSTASIIPSTIGDLATKAITPLYKAISGISVFDYISASIRFSSSLKVIGDGIVNFNNTISKINITSLSTSAAQLIGLVTSIWESIKNAYGKFAENAKSIFGTTINTLLVTIAPQFKVTGETISKSLVDGFTSNLETIKTEVTNTMTAAMTAITDSGIEDSFYTAGSQASQGFANGVKSNNTKITNSVVSMARSALEAAKKALGIQSPSKEFCKIGEFTGQGFVNGLDNYTDSVYGSGVKMADGVMSGLKRTISKIGELVENGIDTQPTIRPVLDLSNVRSGINTMNSMMGMSPSVGVMSRVNSINTSMTNNNGSNDDVIAAIADLKNTIASATGDTYNFGDITYDDGSNIAEAVKIIIKAIKMEGRS